MLCGGSKGIVELARSRKVGRKSRRGRERRRGRREEEVGREVWEKGGKRRIPKEVAASTRRHTRW